MERAAVNVVLLECWSVVEDDDGYMAPELRTKYLRGRVYGHRDKEDGTHVTTSRIVNANGRRVTTSSGSIYELGNPSAAYLEHLHVNKIRYCEDEPVRVRR